MPPLSWQEARRLIKDTVRPCNEVETVSLQNAHGRILAADLIADRDYPALRRSLRDGFAIRSVNTPGTLKVAGEVRAGDPVTNGPADREAIEIMTGAPVPPEADAVVMIEHVVREGTSIRIDQPVKTGQWINEPGAESRSGAVLLQTGTKLDASHVAILATTGHSQVTVSRRLRIAILSTGDEIVEVEQAPAPHQIRNSNAHMLAALAKQCGADPILLPVAADQPEALKALLVRGLQADMLLVSGGVSAGRYDLVKPTLRDLGVEFHFERVRIQPGGPCAFGVQGKKPVFGLPGNPGSTYVTFQLFAQLAISLLAGERDPVLPLLSAIFVKPFQHRLGLTRFLPAYLDESGLTHIPWQGSSDVPALARANVLLIADENRERWEAGDSIPVMLKL